MVLIMKSKSNPDPRLLITARAGMMGRVAQGQVDEAMIRKLVESFYEAARQDEFLGPLFARHVTDWPDHLCKICDFWSTVVLRTGRYSGWPMAAHMELPELRQMHFERWLQLWKMSVISVIPQASQGAFVLPAQRMAASMSAKLRAASHKDLNSTISQSID